MITRGKFRSLTLINWNGFFARTFELDELVTTLSGGNGAGKSTTMAAFVTALIPDLTLLHFRNTTEAGATSGSRDKGLHGKLRPGVCYAVLDVVNSRHQRILCGVRLQQVAGRDRKVDIKPFVIQGLPTAQYPTTVFTELVDARQARVLNLPELKERLEAQEGVLFKQHNSITDYHAMMFDLGVLAKRLRSSSDRSKFYKLIEASLYGGISSAITRSLRDYLLPENNGVRKAFQDMEAALRENRMTLEAIRVTQSDRDLFKHLITESTNYVASDFMRNMNERRGHVEQVLGLRRELQAQRKKLEALQQQHIEMSQALQAHQLSQSDLETDFQAASDHLNLVQTAVRQQEKIERYRADIEELSENMAEQQEVVETLAEQLAELEAQVQATEEEVDEIKSQLANYQQALSVQQTRAIQYQQATQALEKAKEVAQIANLSPENAAEWLAMFEEKEQAVTAQLLELEQKVSVADAAVSQFEQAYQCVCQIAGDISRGEAWQTAKTILRDWPAQQYQAEHAITLQSELSDLEQRLYSQQDAQRALDQLSKKLGRVVSPEELSTLQEEVELQLHEVAERANALHQERAQLQRERDALQNEIQLQTRKAPVWHAAQDALLHLNEQTEQTMTSSQQVTEQMQAILETERRLVVERDEINQRKRQLEEQITRLSQPSGAEDGRLVGLAEKFGGVLLSEIYDDVTLDDAPYFSALYGPSRHAIVVPQLAAIRSQLEALEETPEDLYFIEGDPQSFDDSVFHTEEMNGAVLVKSGERQWRYSRFPAVPLFGRAARENQLAILNQESEQLMERHAKLSFDIQKSQRLHQSFSQFIGLHVSVAFEPNPETAIATFNLRRGEIERTLNASEAEDQQLRTQVAQMKEQVGWVSKLMPQLHLLLEDELTLRIEALQDELAEAQEAADFVRLHAKSVHTLERMASVLQSDPEQNAQLQATYTQCQASQRQIKSQVFALSEVVARRTHFSYSDSQGMLSESSELSDKLRQRLELAERERQTAREQMRQKQQQSNEYQQTWIALKSAFASKQEMLTELEQEMQLLGVRVDEHTEARAQQRRNELQAVLTSNRERCHQLEKQLMLSDNDMAHLQKNCRRLDRDYLQMRQQVVLSKAAWQRVTGLVKENNMGRRLHRRELGYLDADELRSRSDKALGALRLAVADNEHLRDALRASEDPKNPEKKILFYAAVYQHLRERIRQDIVQTDDPIEAIEQMEIELSRLTDELTSREQKLAISAKSVANIIRKTIQREQNRIQMLNQGLQAVSFGQVNSVRLNVNVKESHATMLSVLAEQHDAHQDLFTNHKITFSEALAKLYQRMNPHIDFGQRTAQTVGEELLDYRHYLELEVEVNRGTDGWLRAESGALSTGEAIGTGMSILVMVVQSWEEESKRLRGKDISPCRLLFLDEAARLDAKSIATLFELCERLEMQLIIAAPENISPEKGTTYKLVRKVFENREHVHVVGLKGFSPKTTEASAEASPEEVIAH